ncbi:MAG TPA: polysaccharide deacetylase family protein [Candidatus Limnocylindrales bacterium]
MTRALGAALLGAAVLALSACTTPHAVAQPIPHPSASASESASPSASPESPSPSAAPTSASPKPKPSTAPPPPPPPGPGPLDCSGSASIDRPQATGPGPLGSVRVTGSEVVALTFDDGPDPVNTPKILDLLRQCGVKATFCLEGAKAAANPTVVRRIASDGHTFCNHTWRHIRQLGTYGPDLIRQDLSDTNNAIRAIVPDAQIGYFRAPGGAWTEDYLLVARELGMTPLHWHVDTRDWESSKWGKGQSMVDHIVSVVEAETHPGSVILSHDFQKPDTTAAYRILLPWLKARFKLTALPPQGL